MGSTLGFDASGRGSSSLRFQLNLSSSVHHVTQLNSECVLELLKLSSTVNECKPLASGRRLSEGQFDLGPEPAFSPDADAGQGLTLVHYSAQLEPCLMHKSTLHTLNTP